MIHAYDKLYLEKARTSLARMLDFATHDLCMDLSEFFGLFINFGVSDLFGSGDPDTLVGKSGIELAYEVLDRSGLSYRRVTPRFTLDRSEEYWTGWALAYFQWATALSFSEINGCIPIEKIRALYSPYHEMDISEFVDHMNERIREAKYLTNLKLLRTRSGFSQSQLASSSGVPLRTIQQYEQRQKSINKAQAEYIFMLSHSLSCDPEDLLEKV